MLAPASTHLTPASVPRRALAALVDGLILSALVQVLHWVVLPPLQSFMPSLETGWGWHVYLLASVSLPCWIYYAGFEGSGAHATPGKRWLALTVVDVYGTSIGWRAATLRTLVKLVPWELAHVALCFPTPVFVTGELPMPKLLFSVYGVLGLYLAATLMTLKKQSIHDLASGTYVIGSKAR